MNREKLDRLGRLNAFQIGVVAIVISTIAAIGVLVVLRRLYATPNGAQAENPNPTSVPRSVAPQPASAPPPTSETGTRPEVPHHFSENLIVPGFTSTGSEILKEDQQTGRSPEGV